jgi:DNA polymerase-3 subunit beta
MILYQAKAQGKAEPDVPAPVKLVKKPSKKVKGQAGMILDALKAIKPSCSAKSAVPMLSHAAMFSRGGKLRLQATTLHSWSTVDVDVPWSEAGEATVPCLKLLDMLKGRPEADVAGTLDAQGRMDFTIGSVTAKIVALPIEEWPVLNDKGWKPWAVLPSAGAFIKALSTVDHALSTDETRLNLTTPYLDQDGTVVATDSHRLVVVKKAAPSGPFPLMLNAAALATLKAAMNPDAELVLEYLEVLHEASEGAEPYIEISHVRFSQPGQSVALRCLEGKYPPYNQIWPNPKSNGLTVVSFDAATMEASVKSIIHLSADRYNAMHFEFEADACKIKVSTTDVGQAETSLPVKIQGPAKILRFNGRYILEALAMFEGEVKWTITDSIGVSSMSQGGNVETAIMPMRQ